MSISLNIKNGQVSTYETERLNFHSLILCLQKLQAME